MDIKGRLLLLVLVALATALLAACGDGGASSGAPPTPARQATAHDPAVREAVSAAPSFDAGHTVHLTAAGIQPQSLASMCCDPIVFKNETGSPISVIFFISKIDSGPIAPGATWQWVPPNPESVNYHIASDPNLAGHIQVESPGS